MSEGHKRKIVKLKRNEVDRAKIDSGPMLALLPLAKTTALQYVIFWLTEAAERPLDLSKKKPFITRIRHVLNGLEGEQYIILISALDYIDILAMGGEVSLVDHKDYLLELAGEMAQIKPGI